MFSSFWGPPDPNLAVEVNYPELSSPVSVEDHEKVIIDKFAQFESLIASNDGWSKLPEYIDQVGDFVVWDRIGLPSTAPSMVKVIGTIPYSDIRGFMELVRSMDMQVLKNWDTDTLTAKVHKVIKPDPVLIEVCATTHSAPFPIASREFVTVRGLRVQEDGSHIQVQTSINSKEFKTDPSIVRGVNVFSGWEVKPLADGKIHVVRITSIDPKGTIPLWVVALYKTKAAQNIEGIRGHLLKLKK